MFIIWVINIYIIILLFFILKKLVWEKIIFKKIKEKLEKIYFWNNEGWKLSKKIRNFSSIKFYSFLNQIKNVITFSIFVLTIIFANTVLLDLSNKIIKHAV